MPSQWSVWLMLIAGLGSFYSTVALYLTLRRRGDLLHRKVSPKWFTTRAGVKGLTWCVGWTLLNYGVRQSLTWDGVLAGLASFVMAMAVYALLWGRHLSSARETARGTDAVGSPEAGVERP